MSVISTDLGNRTVFHFIPYVCHCICLNATCSA